MKYKRLIKHRKEHQKSELGPLTLTFVNFISDVLCKTQKVPTGNFTQNNRLQIHQFSFKKLTKPISNLLFLYVFRDIGRSIKVVRGKVSNGYVFFIGLSFLDHDFPVVS